MGLSSKHRQVVSEYLQCFNKTEAYIRVYGPKSRDSARSAAARLFANVSIQDAIKEGLSEKAMSADEVLMRLAKHARGSMNDFVNFDENGDAYLDIEKAHNSGNMDIIKKFTVNETVRVDASGESAVVSRRSHVELYDSQSALKLIGTHQKLFVERTEHTGKDGEAIEVSAVVSRVIDKVYGDDGD